MVNLGESPPEASKEIKDFHVTLVRTPLCPPDLNGLPSRAAHTLCPRFAQRGKSAYVSLCSGLADRGTRTPDLRITNASLYHLSYVGVRFILIQKNKIDKVKNLIYILNIFD